MALIRCENVSIGYEGQTVVRDLSFQISAGDYLCIVGENGSGKSTLVKSLLGLKSVEKGRIIYGDGLRQNEIGYLPQQTDVQKDFPASVYEVVLSGRLNSRYEISRSTAFGICPGDRGKEYYLPEPSAPPGHCSCWMNL